MLLTAKKCCLSRERGYIRPARRRGQGTAVVGFLSFLFRRNRLAAKGLASSGRPSTSGLQRIHSTTNLSRRRIHWPLAPSSFKMSFRPMFQRVSNCLGSCVSWLFLGNWLTCSQRTVAPIAVTFLAGGIAAYPRRTAFAEAPSETVRVYQEYRCGPWSLRLTRLFLNVEETHLR